MKVEKNRFIKLLLFNIFILLGSSGSFAQQKTVSGIVVDNNNEPLMGVTVSVVNANQGVITDANGFYSLSVDSKATLQFSFIGFETQVVAVGNQKIVNVILVESVQQLDELVVIGYGTVKKRDLTGATSSIKGSELAQVPVTTTAQAITGKVAGVNVVTSSGAPGAGVQVTIRGGSSITQNTQPLYIVDGFEMSNALTNIDANDIESIEVLKDASATAIYGARGSNGIIMITTKNGKKGKTTVTYNNFFSFEGLSKRLDMVSNTEKFVKYQYEMAELQGKTTPWSNVFDNSLGVDAPDFYTGAYDRIQNRYSNADAIDWQEEVFGGYALTQNHNVGISTGNEQTQMLLSYNYRGQEGLLANHNYEGNTLRAKINSELYKGIRLDFNALFSNTSTDGGGGYSGLKNVLLQPISGGTLVSQDMLLHSQTYPDFSSLDSSYDTANPLVQNEAATSNKRNRLFTINAGVEFDIVKNLTFRTNGSYSWSNSKSTSFADENSTSNLMDPVNTGINGSIGNSESYKYQITNTLNYNGRFGEKHKIGLLAGHEVTYSESEGNSLSLKQFPYPNFGLDDISNATVSSKSTSHSRSGIVSVFGRLNYNYNERYLFTATLRSDGSSKFAAGNKWGFFPSASGAWRISEEEFWKSSELANYIGTMKLRVGYGVTGNNGIGNNLYTTVLSQTDYPINSTQGNPAYVPSSTLGNKKLKWETLNATNIGLDMTMFNSRLNIVAEWYNNEIGNMLMSSIIPASTGYTRQYQNIGEMRNRGWEFSINTVNVDKRNLKWTSDFNISFNTSKVVSLEKDQLTKTFTVGSNRAGTVNYYATVGERLGDMYGYVYKGVYTTDDFIQNSDGSLTLKDGVVKPYGNSTPSPGDIKFAADNEAGDQFTRKMVKIGNGTPDFIGGFNNTFLFKGFDLGVFMKFSVGNDIYNATKHSMSPYALFQNVPKEFENNYYRLIDPVTGQRATSLSRIKELNPNEASRLWSLNNTNSSYITYPSSYYVEDGSYLRIAQVTLGYTFPKSLIQKVKISNLRMYCSVNNLATITGYSGYDPEVSSANDNVICTPGYDSSTYPRSRSYVVGLNLTF
jgi:TonB-linked SusC/RagA family outer membrane protein